MSTAPLSLDSVRILVIDDNAENRMLLSSQLGLEGYQVLQAPDGRTGIEAARKRLPDLILLDVMMPDMNGFEVCKRLKRDSVTEGIPVIMLTALREVQYRIRGIEAGADEFLSRPYHRAELLVRVRALVQLKRARENLEEERNRLQLLYNISRAISTQLDVQQMMASILTQTQAAVKATKGSIILLDENQQVTHRILVRENLAPRVADAITQAVMQRGLAGWLVRHKRGVVIDDAAVDERWITLPDDQDSPRSIIGVPLSRTNRRVVGVLFLMHQDPYYFTQEHLALLETIGAQITAAIENAFLFTDIDEERGKLGAILAQSTDAIITTDEYWRVARFNKSAEALFGLSANSVVSKSLRHVIELGVLVPMFTKAQSEAITQEVQLETGKVLHASVSPVPGVGYVAVMQDITDVKRAEQLRLRRAEEEQALVKKTFSRYMGPRLVEHVLSDAPGLLSQRERRWAVVLFADLRDFTRMVVNGTPDVTVRVLNEFFTNMMNIVHEFDGTIFDLTGDELLVGFNVPFDQADAAYRALLTALTMQRHFDRLRVSWHKEFGVKLGLGTGIDQGFVVVGNVGAETRMTFRMVGEAVNIAHRLVDLAEDGQIVVTAGVHDEVEQAAQNMGRSVDFASIGQIPLKGKEFPQELFALKVERTQLD